MRAFVITGPGQGGVEDVEEPVAKDAEVIVQVERAGVCGTDLEFWSGEMSYLHTGQAAYPIRIGHEWCGTVTALGPGADPAWLGKRVTGDTMLGCGRCERCLGGRQHLCADRFEIGIRHGWPGALAERLPVPEKALLPLPDAVDAALGALVEPGGNALRAVRAANLAPGERLLVLGPGTIGLLAALIARAQGAEVHVLGQTVEFARSIGLPNAWTAADLPALRWDAIIDASNAAALPGLALDLIEPGRRVVYIGIAGQPSLVDTRQLVLKDVTAVGILSASGGLAGTIDLYASGAVDPRPLVGATVDLGRAGEVLSGSLRMPAPKIHVRP
ncbi:MAG TPA: alcohol dehydrogenase catalytic domain-containing protein [Actinoplanes sp.]|nr:alcohol dehydrogenase catalytic domain-containing protein [Actinoplanes sp.]